MPTSRLRDQTSVRCEFCGRYFRAITWTHLRKAHGFRDVAEYKEEFGLEFVTCEATRRLASEVRTRWTPKRILRMLRARKRAGLSVCYMRVAEEEPRLVAAARRCFGSYQAAVDAAGYNYRKLCPLPDRRKWTEKTILDRVRQYKREGRPLNPAAVIRYDNGLYLAALRHGGWRAITEKAGVPAPLIQFQRSRYTQDEAVAALRKLARTRRLMGSKRMGRHPQYKSLFFACCHYWGSLLGAAKAAGIAREYTKQVYIDQGIPVPPARRRRRRTKRPKHRLRDR